MNHLRIISVACCVTAMTCLALAIMLFLSIRYERTLYDQHMRELVDSVRPALERLEAQDQKAVEKVGRKNWKRK